MYGIHFDNIVKIQKHHSLSSLDSDDDTLTDSEQSRIIEVLCQEELLINWAEIQNTINEDAMKTIALMNKYVRTWKRNSRRSIQKRTESVTDYEVLYPFSTAFFQGHCTALIPSISRS